MATTTMTLEDVLFSELLHTILTKLEPLDIARWSRVNRYWQKRLGAYTKRVLRRDILCSHRQQRAYLNQCYWIHHFAGQWCSAVHRSHLTEEPVIYVMDFIAFSINHTTGSLQEVGINFRCWLMRDYREHGVVKWDIRSGANNLTHYHMGKVTHRADILAALEKVAQAEGPSALLGSILRHLERPTSRFFIGAQYQYVDPRYNIVFVDEPGYSLVNIVYVIIPNMSRVKEEARRVHWLCRDTQEPPVHYTGKEYLQWDWDT